MARAKPPRTSRLRELFASPEMRAALSVIGRKGGRGRMAALTAEERRELARKAAAARWGKKTARRRRPRPE